MSRLLILPLIIAPLLLFLPGTHQNPHPIRIMSFNIRYGTAKDGENSWTFRNRSVIRLIQRESPDLVGIQEGLRFQLDDIRSSLPRFGEAGRGRDDGLTKGEYAAILFDTTRFLLLAEGTFWFSDTPAIPGSASWGNTIARICTWVRVRDKTNNSVLDVYNIHLDHESQPSRERSVLALIDTIRHRSSFYPVLITGDFNAGEKNDVLHSIRAAGFSDSYRTIHPNDSLVGTFHAFKGLQQGEKIDYILADEKSAILDAAILSSRENGRYPSDHFPVTALIQLKNDR